MPLTLTIRNADSLENGSPLSLTLENRGATIGRAATADWSLPDTQRHISSRHCEIRFVDGRYEANDISTNGTFLFGQQARLSGPHTLSQGDVLVIGRFEIAVALDDASAAAAAAANAAPQVAQWKGWADSTGGREAAPAISESKWDARPSGSAISGTGPLSQSWAAPTPSAPASPPPGRNDGWGPGGGSAQGNAGGGWGAAPTPSPSAAPGGGGSANVWDNFAASNQVDWARGGFGGAPTPAPAPPPPPPQQQVASPPPPPPAPSGQALAALAGAAGIDPARLAYSETDTAAVAGDLLRRLISGLVVMLEARARAKSQMGAQGTSLELDGNNPLKFVRAPEEALVKLLNPAERGFMQGDRAVEDAFKDLQAHQMATLRAMQGALRATLERFSPTAIKSRAEDAGALAKILPGARDAALWKAYEREFGGVAQGSDEAFMDVFAKEFRKAYEEISRGGSGSF